MASGTRAAVLTQAQARLMKRHRAGLLRLAGELATRKGIAPTDLMLVLAHRGSCLGHAIGRFTEGRPASRDALVLPGLARELPTWLERLAVVGPIWDCTSSADGVPVIVVDDLGTMALCR